MVEAASVTAENEKVRGTSFYKPRPDKNLEDRILMREYGKKQEHIDLDVTLFEWH